MTSVNERFRQFDCPGYYSRVSPEGGMELYIGLDDEGRMSMEYRYPFRPVCVSGTSAIEVTQFEKPGYRTLRFSLSESRMSGLFCKLCEDIEEQTRGLKDGDEGYRTVTERFWQWKKLFAGPPKDTLSEDRIMGLIGEILFLREDLADERGLSVALKSWSGQEMTHKDFSCGDTWYEVKSVSSGKTAVRISSLEQLDGSSPGILAVFALEKMSPEYSGISLNGLVLGTRDMFTDTWEQDDFLGKVTMRGYRYSDAYDGFVYRLSGKALYRVSDGFPRLTPGNVPPAVKKASYEIGLTDIEPFKVRHEE